MATHHCYINGKRHVRFAECAREEEFELHADTFPSNWRVHFGDFAYRVHLSRNGFRRPHIWVEGARITVSLQRAA